MAIFNFLENFFFISLAITFGLMLMLVYHFKERITVSEKRIDTINDVLISVVKELKNIQFAAAASATALSNTIPAVPPSLIPFPTTVVSPNIEQAKPPVEHIFYDISEVDQNTGGGASVSVPSKIVVSDVEDEEDSEYSEESSSETEQSSDDGSEPEDDVSDLGEEESISSVDDEDDDSEHDNDDEEEADIKHPVILVSETLGDVPIEIDAIEEPEPEPEPEPELTPIEIKIDYDDVVFSETEVASPKQEVLGFVEPMEVEVEVDTVGEPEAHVSAPTTDISASDLSATYSLPVVSVELSDITEIIVPDTDTDIDKIAGVDVASGSSMSIMELEPLPEPVSEPIHPVSEPREEKPAVVVSRDAKEQKKEVYRKMSIHQLRTIAISSGLSADNKMKKVDLIRLLETLDDEEDQ